MILTAVCVALVVWLVVTNVPVDTFGTAKRFLLLVLLAIFIVAALASTKVIPWGARSWAEWRKPEVLGTIAYLLLGAAGFIAGIGPALNPPGPLGATEVGQKRMFGSLTKQSAVLDQLTGILTKRFPSDPPILHDINGHWGDLEPACDVIWDIRIIERHSDAALVAQTIKTPPTVKPYRFVGSIIRATEETLFVEGVEPDAALGKGALFTLNGATDRLSWDDRARGSGGVELYRPCT